MHRSRRYEQLKRTVQAHDSDGLALAQKLYPIFKSEDYLRIYHKQEEKMREKGLDVVQRNRIHMLIRQDIIQAMRTYPQATIRFK